MTLSKSNTALFWLGLRHFQIGRFHHARVKGYALGIVYLEVW